MYKPVPPAIIGVFPRLVISSIFNVLFSVSEISNEVIFFLRNNITNNLNVIYQDLMNYENDELLNLTSEIRNTMSDICVTEDINSLWDYINKIFDKLMLSYNNYKNQLKLDNKKFH